MRNINSYLFVLVLFCLLNCGKTEKVDTRLVKEALKEREIKKVTGAEITDAGSKRGEEDGKIAIECINTEGSFTKNCFDSTRIAFIDTVRILTANSDLSLLSKTETELFQAYQYNFSQNQDLYSNIQDLKNGQLLYTTPFFIYPDDKKVFEGKIEGKQPSSFGIVAVYYLKKKLIVEL